MSSVMQILVAVSKIMVVHLKKKTHTFAFQQGDDPVHRSKKSKMVLKRFSRVLEQGDVAPSSPDLIKTVELQYLIIDQIPRVMFVLAVTVHWSH